MVNNNVNPNTILSSLKQHFPACITTLLQPEDELYFIQLSKKLGKPVNYIPTIDADLKFWLKKDSLWYCDDLRSVPNNDPNTR